MDTANTDPFQILNVVRQTGASVWARTINGKSFWFPSKKKEKEKREERQEVDIYKKQKERQEQRQEVDFYYYFEVAIENVLDPSHATFTVLPSIKDEYASIKDEYPYYSDFFDHCRPKFPYSGRRLFIPPAGTKLTFATNNGTNSLQCEYHYDSRRMTLASRRMTLASRRMTLASKIPKVELSKVVFELDLTCFDTQAVCLLYQFFVEQNQFEISTIKTISQYSFGYYGVPGGGMPAQIDSGPCYNCKDSQRLGSIAKLLLAIEEGNFVVASAQARLAADFESFMKGHEDYPSRCCCYDDWGEKNPLNPNYRPERRIIRNTIETLPSSMLKSLITSFFWK